MNELNKFMIKFLMWFVVVWFNMTSRRALCLEEKINLILSKRKKVVSLIDHWVNVNPPKLLKMTNYYFLFCERINKFILNKHLFIKEKVQNMLSTFEKIS